MPSFYIVHPSHKENHNDTLSERTRGKTALSAIKVMVCL